MVFAKNISKSFGKKQVLNDLSCFIEKGSVSAIVGENGAGKSTLLKILIGELKADSGTIELKGKSGYCPQFPQVFSMLTVEENIRYFASAYQLSRDFWRIRSDELLDQLGFLKYNNFLVKHLSGGTRQKLNLAISLLHNPDIIILDEPYAAFDFETYMRFNEMMIQLKEKGKAILIVTHLINNSENFDNVFTLNGGHLQ